MRLWTTSRLGLGIWGTETGRGDRSRRDQMKFRDNLIEAYNSTNPNPRSETLWCPLLHEWIPTMHMHAAHVFDWAHGLEAMDEIFGWEREKVEELSDILNGLMLSEYAEKRVEQGDIVIVPNVGDAASTEEIDAWSVSEPKAYEFRVHQQCRERDGSILPWQFENHMERDGWGESAGPE